MYDNDYVPPILTVDSVVFQIIDNQLVVLLIKRNQEPFKGSWALPGGYNAAGETTTDALKRVLQTKSGLKVGSLKLIEQLYTFDTVARDPRGHAVSVTYMGMGVDLRLTKSPTTQGPQFFPVDSLPKLAYDHTEIITYAQERLRSKLEYTNAAFSLLPTEFTLTQLQSVYETVLGRTLDKRNFRKRFLAFGALTETDHWYREGAHRPARLYRFAKQQLEPFRSNLE